MSASVDVVSLVEGALRLGVSYEVALRMVLTHRLKGERRGRRWVVEREDLERVARERAPIPADGD